MFLRTEKDRNGFIWIASKKYMVYIYNHDIDVPRSISLDYVTLGNVESQKFLRTEKNQNNLIWVVGKDMHISMYIHDIDVLKSISYIL